MSPISTSLGFDRAFVAREAMVASHLPYAGHVDDVTLACHDGTLCQIIRLEGFAFETADDDELNYRQQLREALWRSLAHPRLTLHHHVIRRRVHPDLPEGPAQSYAAELDTAWRAALSRKALFVNTHYLTLAYAPAAGGLGLIERLWRRSHSGGERLDQDLAALHDLAATAVNALAPYGPRLLSLRQGHSEPAAFLAELLDGEPRPIAPTEAPLAELLAARRLTFGYEAIDVGGPGEVAGRHFAAMVSLKDYPGHAGPGMLDDILRIPCELVLSESFSFLEREQALGRMGLALRRLRAADDDSFSLRDELALARDELGAGREAYGEHHLSLLVRADTLDRLKDHVATARATLNALGAVAVQEEVNLEPCFWAQFPGNRRYIARRAMISAANFASLASFHNHAGGQRDGNHWGPAVTVLETTAHTPYHFNFHHQDLGNFTLIGPSGSGKTVLLTFLLSQAQRLAPRIIYFDKDRGAEAFIRASGGQYETIRPGSATGFNPLRLPDTPVNRAFLVDLLGQLLGGVQMLSAEEQASIVAAVGANYDQAEPYRQLRYLRELFAGIRRPEAGDLAARLARWCDLGDLGWLFDNEGDLLPADAELYGCDLTGLLDDPVLRTPAMMYLFHRIEQSLDGRPTIIVVDEGWKVLDDPAFARRLKDWQKTIRKRNGIVGFCTQSASDALDSAIASTIIEQSATQIFLPNHKASAADYIDGFGLTPYEYQLVRSLPDHSHSFLIKQSDHSTVARLDLGALPEHLAVLAGTERSVRLLDRLRAEHGDDPAAWLPPYRAALARGRR